MFKLVENWREIAWRSHSMWGFYLTGAFLLLPEIIFYGFGIDTNPRLWWFAALFAWLYGMFGRLLTQAKIDRTTTRSPVPVALIAAVLVGALMFGDWRGGDMPLAGPDVVELVDDDADQFLAVAVPFVGRWEGLRLVAYQDIVGVWTVCYGETKGVQPGDQYSQAECDAMLAVQLMAYRDGLHEYLTSETISQRLPVHRDVAFTSLAYNVGKAGAGRSTAVRRLNASDIAGACEALTWWNKAGQRVVRGLVLRRADEHGFCMRGLA